MPLQTFQVFYKNRFWGDNRKISNRLRGGLAFLSCLSLGLHICFIAGHWCPHFNFIPLKHASCVLHGRVNTSVFLWRFHLCCAHEGGWMFDFDSKHGICSVDADIAINPCQMLKSCLLFYILLVLPISNLPVCAWSQFIISDQSRLGLDGSDGNEGHCHETNTT